MRAIIVSALLCLCFYSNAQKISGGIIYTLGKDTTLAGNYYQEGDVFYIHVVAFSPSVNIHQWRGKFFPNGEMEMAEGINTRPVAGKENEMISSYMLHRKGDSTYLEQKRGETVTKQQFKGRTMITNSIGGSTFYYLIPLLAQHAPAKSGDSVMSTHYVLNSPRPFSIKRLPDNTVILGSSVMGYHRLRFSAKGEAVGIDAIGSSSNVKGQLVPPLNMDSMIKAAVLKESNRPALGALNKLDSVQANVNGVAMKIKYSRPSVRNRVIYGEVVPYNRFWRTGANAATKLTIDKPIYIQGKELPAGEYSIWTMPSQSGWKIMFNRQANIWGTEYNPQHDVLVVPLQTESLKEPVELFTFTIEQKGEEGEIAFMWERLRGVVKFSVGK